MKMHTKLFNTWPHWSWILLYEKFYMVSNIFTFDIRLACTKKMDGSLSENLIMCTRLKPLTGQEWSQIKKDHKFFFSKDDRCSHRRTSSYVCDLASKDLAMISPQQAKPSSHQTTKESVKGEKKKEKPPSVMFINNVLTQRVVTYWGS